MDHAATTPVRPEVLSAMLPYFTDCFANASGVYAASREARRAIDEARGQVALLIGAQPEEIHFTSGGSESDNWAISGVLHASAKGKKRVITTAIEHHAVLNPMKKLEERGFEVTYLQPDALGRISLSDLQAALRRNTILVSIMMVNNESGAVMPIEKMAKLTHRLCPDAIFHTDAVQGFFKTPFRAASLGADLISVSGHKIHAAKGVGALYIRPGLSLPPLLYGGGQESKLRSGTEMLPLIAGFAAACESKLPTRQRDIAEQNRLKLLCRELLSRMDGVMLLGAQDAPHIVNLAVRGVRSQGLINALQDRDVYVSAGSACSRGHRSQVLEAMRVEPALIDGSVRVSLSDETTESDILAFAAALAAAIAALR